MFLEARAAGMSVSIASITPHRMPMSLLPLSDWLGSSRLPPLITRSYLSFGPIAALAGPAMPTAAADVESARKSRRDNADMTLPPIYRYRAMMRLRPVFDKQARDTSAG